MNEKRLGVQIVTALDPGWRAHEIKSVRSFAGRTVGSLSQNELTMIREKWMPACLHQWQRTTPENQADYHAFVNAIGEAP